MGRLIAFKRSFSLRFLISLDSWLNGMLMWESPRKFGSHLVRFDL